MRKRGLLLLLLFLSGLALVLDMSLSLAVAQSAMTSLSATGKAGQPYAELSRVPESARTRSNPLENDSTAATAGKKLFERHCAECHGTSGEGGKKAPSLHVQEVRTATPGALFWILTNGVVRRGMPVWSRLPEPQRWQIVSYLKSLD